MNEWTVAIIIILSVLALVIFVWLVIRIIKKRRAKKGKMKEIPAEVLKDFETAEKMIEQNRGNMTPYEIMWEIAKSRNNERRINQNGENNNNTSFTQRGSDRIFSPTQSRIGDTELSKLSERRADIQGSNAPGTTSNKTEHRESKTNHRRGLFRRR